MTWAIAAVIAFAGGGIILFILALARCAEHTSIEEQAACLRRDAEARKEKQRRKAEKRAKRREKA